MEILAALLPSWWWRQGRGVGRDLGRYDGGDGEGPLREDAEAG